LNGMKRAAPSAFMRAGKPLRPAHVSCRPRTATSRAARAPASELTLQALKPSHGARSTAASVMSERRCH